VRGGSSRSELCVEPPSLFVLAAYFIEELDVLSSGLDEREEIGVELEAFRASPATASELENGAGVLLKEPVGDPGTEGSDGLASTGEETNPFKTMGLDCSIEFRRLPGNIMSPLKKADVDRLKDIVRVNSPDLLPGARRTLVKPAPTA
jgi:hypothetical protein